MHVYYHFDVLASRGIRLDCSASHMILDVAGVAPRGIFYLLIENFLELCEDGLWVLLEDAPKSVQTASVRHAYDACVTLQGGEPAYFKSLPRMRFSMPVSEAFWTSAPRPEMKESQPSMLNRLEVENLFLRKLLNCSLLQSRSNVSFLS